MTIKNEKSIDELVEKEFGMNSSEIKHIIKSAGKSEPKRYDVRKLPSKNKWMKFGVISDTHMGHKMYRPDILKHAVKNFNKQDVEFVLMPGDILEGMSGREGHIYELDHIGASEQLNYAVSELKQIKQPIYAITATNSHDGWYTSKNNMGFEVGPELERRIDNFNFLGYDEADLITHQGLRIRMTHPGDGTAYALCFDDKTEILTEDGWVLFKDLEKGKKVFTFNTQTEETVLEEPEDYFEYYYEGEMILFESKQFNFCVTPNHRMLVKKPWNNIFKKEGWTFIEAEKIKPRQFSMKKGLGTWKGKSIKFIKIPKPKLKKHARLKTYKERFISKDWFEFMGWFLSEGNLNKANKQIEISQCPEKNPEKYKEIISLFERMGFKPYCYGPKIRVTSLQLFEYLKQFGLSHQKFVPDYIMNSTPELIDIFLNTLYKGDGCFKNGKFVNYTTNSKRLADDVQILNLKAGRVATIKMYEHRKTNFNQTKPIYQISVSYTKEEVELGKAKNKFFERLQYKGKIYCIQTPNRTLFTRRNGKTLWTGNSYKLQKYLNGISGGQKPHLLFEGHYHKSLYMFYRNVHAFDSGTLEGQTIFMKKKGTPAHLGYWIVEVNGTKEGVNVIRPEFTAFYE